MALDSLVRVPFKCVRSLIRAFVFVVVFGSLLLMMKARHGGREHWLSVNGERGGGHQFSWKQGRQFGLG